MLVGGREAYLNVVLLQVQGIFGDEAGEVRVLHTKLLDLAVEETLDLLPDGVGPRPEHIAAAHVVVFNHLRLGDDLRVPILQTLVFLCFHPKLGPLLGFVGFGACARLGALARLGVLTLLGVLARLGG